MKIYSTKAKKNILLLLGILWVEFLSAQVYVIKNDTVYYYDRIIQHANTSTFDLVYENKLFAKDKNYIFYKGKKTTYDINSFEIVNNHRGTQYIKDKNDIYIYFEGIYKKIKSSSPSHFTLLTDEISLDNDIIYWEYSPIVGSDAKTFSTINNDDLFKDQFNVYKEGYRLPIESKGLKTVYSPKKIIEFIANKNIVCSKHGYSHQMNAKHFEYINWNYAKDDKKILYRDAYL